ncbi:MAG: hypothetical protein B6244_03630 [Candidatus Cloacimonetes bacterium 4572_55]|nr:MAG: hypothetical protein B6244_03630 [Candidatus Cloacimonetes bacterium 4572_55]
MVEQKSGFCSEIMGLILKLKFYLQIIIVFLLPVILFGQEFKPGLAIPFKGYKDSATVYSMQEIIDSAQPGDVINLKPGRYTGPGKISINNLTINGLHCAEITVDGKGSIFYIQADSVRLVNLKITNSGHSHDKIDCAVSIRGNYNIIENCLITDCLFGIDLQDAQNNEIIHNEICSKNKDKAMQGDAIRLWYSFSNKIQHNYWHNVRDMVVWYSEENLFEGNLGVGNRYSIHFMYSHNNRIQNNEFYDSSVGVFLMYSERTIMVGNTIVRSSGPTGICLGLKETSNNQILNNRFIYSSQGIYFDTSPFVLEKKNIIENNEIAFCRVGIQFHSNLYGNVLRKNQFIGNLEQVAVRGKTANGNKWESNYWDDYQGFDQDYDNIGDTPYQLLDYVEHLWSTNQNVKFFYGSPVLVILDFLERLAPLSQPKLILEDEAPIFELE